MATLHLKGRITENGELEVELPPDVQAGDVDVIIQPHIVEDDVPWEDRPWTEAELDELMTRTPKTGAEIVKMLEETDGWWTGYGITDGAAYVEQIRRKEEQRSREKWSLDS
jgi:hypothetical protein